MKLFFIFIKLLLLFPILILILVNLYYYLKNITYFIYLDRLLPDWIRSNYSVVASQDFMRRNVLYWEKAGKDTWERVEGGGRKGLGKSHFLRASHLRTKDWISLYSGRLFINMEVSFIFIYIGGDISAHIHLENMFIHTSHVQNGRKSPTMGGSFSIIMKV